MSKLLVEKIGVYIDGVMDVFGRKSGSSLGGSKYNEVHKFSIDDRDVEFIIRWIEVQDVVEQNHRQLERSNRSKICQLLEENIAIFIFW